MRERPCGRGSWGVVCCFKLDWTKMDDFSAGSPPCDGRARGRPAAAACLCARAIMAARMRLRQSARVCVCVSGQKASLNVICARFFFLPPPPQTEPLWSDGCCFCSFLAQKGPSELKLLPEEYSVMIGSYPCNISFNNDQLFHCTINGLLSSSEGELPVTVSVRARAPPRPNTKTQDTFWGCC